MWHCYWQQGMELMEWNWWNGTDGMELVEWN
jgi:hypothetical protein